MHAGIVGAGLLGRLLAYRLMENNWQVTVFDKGNSFGEGSAAYAAGGMLSPIVEQETAEFLIYQLGKKSLDYWQAWLPQLQQRIFFQKKGSILISHAEDFSRLQHLVGRIKNRVGTDTIRFLDQSQLRELEPELSFQQGYFLSEEAQIDTRALLISLSDYLAEHGASLNFETKVINIRPGLVETENNQFEFDWVFDCRGIGAQDSYFGLRGVRGELIYLYAPEVNLTRVIRFFHPRYRLYVISRPGHIYLVGATEIESCDSSPISVRSCLELLSAVYSIHKGFAEARIKETITAIRPAFLDNLPRLYYQSGLIAINGLYRHGFLIAPVLVKTAINLVQGRRNEILYPMLIKES